MEKTEAILIGRTRYSETSLILHWCSLELGLFRTMAKGAARPKSPLAGTLDLFVTVELGYLPARKGDLHTLVEARWTKPRLGLRASYGRLLAATYLVKLIALVVEPHAPLPVIHDLLDKGLDYLCDHDPSPALIQRFELRLAEDLGILSTTEAEAGLAAHALEESFHRKLPVQRRQLFTWIAQQRRPDGEK